MRSFLFAASAIMILSVCANGQRAGERVVREKSLKSPYEKGAQVRSKNNRRTKSAERSKAAAVFYVNESGTRSLPFSEAVRVGDVLYLSGQIGVDAEGKLAVGGVEAETRRIFENMRDVLERRGSSLERVFKCTVMLDDIKNDYAPMNAVYRTYFAEGRMPARSTFGANGLALGAKVEIECWATLQ